MILTDDVHRYWNVKESNSEPDAEIFKEWENIKIRTVNDLESYLAGENTRLGIGNRDEGYVKSQCQVSMGG